MREIVSVERSFNSSAGEAGIACTWEGTGWCLVCPSQRYVRSSLTVFPALWGCKNLQRVK